MSTTVAIDPGHGGWGYRAGERVEFTGVVSGELVEREWTLDFSHELVTALCATTEYGVVMLRDSNEYLPFSERGARARAAGADVCFHIHVNAARKGHYQGVTCYHWPGNRKAAAIAQRYLDALPPRWQAKHRETPIPADDDRFGEWIEAPRAVMRRMPCASVLLELGFATNPTDNRMLRDESCRGDLLRAAIAAARHAHAILPQAST